VQEKLHLFGGSPAGLAQSHAAGPVLVSGVMSFNGARRIGVLAFAKTTTVTARGDWASPSFDGGFLPIQRRVVGDGGPAIKGFSATWTVPYVARGVAEEGGEELLGRLGATEMAVSFVEPANPYQSVARSLKYALLFVGLVFLAYFIFETTTGKRVHPAQYVLVGLTQIIFYLLLLSIAERLGFDLGFLIASGATVALISLYAGAVFGGLWRFLLALVLFSGLYGLIYVLMRLEDYALLVGAVACFAAIALVMYFTRGIDWYGVRQAPPQESEG
jgi:inner membrane protein